MNPERDLCSRAVDRLRGSVEKSAPLAATAKRRGRPALEVKGQVVSCRLPAEELQAFDALCGHLGGSRSDGMRSILRMAAGFLEFSREDSARLDEIRYELGKIGTNVNQIALAANRGRVPLVRPQWMALDALRRALPGLRKALSEVIAERRRRGVGLFRRFAEEERASRGCACGSGCTIRPSHRFTTRRGVSGVTGAACVFSRRRRPFARR